MQILKTKYFPASDTVVINYKIGEDNYSLEAHEKPLPEFGFALEAFREHFEQFTPFKKPYDYRVSGVHFLEKGQDENKSYSVKVTFICSNKSGETSVNNSFTINEKDDRYPRDKVHELQHQAIRYVKGERDELQARFVMPGDENDED